jgi:hypothetical protein
MHSTIATPLNEAGPFETSDVLRDDIQRRWKLGCEIGDTTFALGEQFENSPPGWMGKRSESVVDCGRIFIHVDEYLLCPNGVGKFFLIPVPFNQAPHSKKKRSHYRRSWQIHSQLVPAHFASQAG